MPNPIKAKNSPYWHFDFQCRGVRFHGSTKCESKREAQRVIDGVWHRAIHGEEAKPPITVNEACSAWWQDKGQFMSAHATYYTQIRHLAALGKATPLADIDLIDLTRYAARRRAKASNATVNRDIELARRIWRHAAVRGFDVPTIKWGEILLPEPSERIRELSQDEQAALFEKLPAHLKPIVEFAILSGKRRSEIIALRWADVDLGARRATFSVKGGGKHVLPLTTRLVALIANQPKVCAQVFTYEARSTSARHKAKRVKGVRYPFSKQGWTRQWRKALADAGIEDFRFHDLRHTAGTRSLRASGNLKAVQKQLGHKDIKTTARYAHALEDDVRAVMEAAESQNSPKVTKSENAGDLRNAG